MAKVINSLALTDGNYVFTTPYATCSTDAAAAAKVATITPVSNFSLETGARVAVKFANDNVAGSPTLNVNSTGAKAIYFKNASLAALNYWSAGQIVDFIYDGTNWVCSAVVTDNNTHYASNLVSTNSSGGLTNAAADPTSGAGYLYLNLIENSIVRNSHKIVGSGLTKVTSNASGDITISSSLSSWDTSDKIFLIGATSQSTATSSTGSHDTAYVGTDGCLYSNSQKVATLGDANEFTGPNSFTTNVIIKSSKGLITQGSSALQYTEYNYGKIKHVPDATNSSSNYTLTIPNKTGTIALTSDLSGYVDTTNTQSVAGNKTFTGMTNFSNIVACQSGIIATNGSSLLDNSSLKYNCIIRYTNYTTYTLTIPSKTGTIALTSDIPINTATLSGTTLSITLS